jgi:hypothetical protein
MELVWKISVHHQDVSLHKQAKSFELCMPTARKNWFTSLFISLHEIKLW